MATVTVRGNDPMSRYVHVSQLFFGVGGGSKLDAEDLSVQMKTKRLRASCFSHPVRSSHALPALIPEP